MEILTSFIALLLVLSFLLKVSFLPRWGMAAACLLMAVAVHFVILAMASLPVSTVNGWITVPDIMLDGAVLLVLEAVWMTAFCFARPGGQLRFLLWNPGLLAIPAVGWAWNQLLYSRPGIDFTRFAWIAALITLTAAFGGVWMLRRFLPEEDIRLEGLFLVNLFLLLLAIAATGAITF